jgi:hypothetical protein
MPVYPPEYATGRAAREGPPQFRIDPGNRFLRMSDGNTCLVGDERGLADKRHSTSPCATGGRNRPGVRRSGVTNAAAARMLDLLPTIWIHAWVWMRVSVGTNSACTYSWCQYTYASKPMIVFLHCRDGRSPW